MSGAVTQTMQTLDGREIALADVDVLALEARLDGPDHRLSLIHI